MIISSCVSCGAELSKSATSEVDINQHEPKFLPSTPMTQTIHLNSTWCKQNTLKSSHYTVTFAFAFFMIFLSVLLTSLISVFLTIYLFKRMQKEEQCHNSCLKTRKSDGINWNILKQLETEIASQTSVNSLCSIEVPTPMQIIEPKIFHSIGSLNTNHIYEVMKPGMADKSEKLYYFVDKSFSKRKTGTSI